MKRIILSLSIILATAGLAFGMTTAFFNDNELSTGNTFTAGTIDISVDNQNPWIQAFSIENILPGEVATTSLEITNVGKNPLKLWKKIKNIVSDENGIVEPEQEWYTQENGGNPKNDLDEVMIYEMLIDDQIIVPSTSAVVIDNIRQAYMWIAELEPEQTVTVQQNYYLPLGTENWAQSDKLIFDIEYLALQTDAPQPGPSILFMENKNTSNWSPIVDAKFGVLNYTPVGETFDYQFLGLGLTPQVEYCLIYYADGYPGNHPGYFFGSSPADNNGQITLSNSVDLGFDLPHPNDTNYPDGAKIWLVECSTYDQANKKILGWSPTGYMFEYWPPLITYHQAQGYDYNSYPDASNDNNDSNLQVIQIDEIGTTTGQYGYDYDYTTSTVNFTYSSPSSILTGSLDASGLKPYTTYQVKFEGKPVCQNGAGGNDTANEYLGYKGRWTCVSGTTCTGDAAARNRSDAEYEANQLLVDSDPNKECMVGYLVWDFLTADSNGDAVASLTTSHSYHVLWCGGGTCDTNVNTYLDFLDLSHPTIKFCPANKVNGEIERFSCGGMNLDPGSYDVRMVLTEESFHQGNWATVLGKDISFDIN